MNSRHIVVVGASSGGFEALKTLVRGLPIDLNASILIVWHVSPDVFGVLPQVLNKLKAMPAAHALDREEIRTGRIYVAPPDHHMLVDDGHIRLTRGPRENLFRPAIDPLFRSAAYRYGPNVIGIILSGSLDDGTSGLWTVKRRGGIAVVQDPNDAEVPSMPENAMREVDVDYTVPIAEMPKLVVNLIQEQNMRSRVAIEHSGEESNRLQVEIGIAAAAEKSALESGIMNFGDISPYTCPECHGVLSAIRESSTKRFRCHTGHAFTVDSLLATISENIETSLWNALRGVDESIILLNHMGDHFAELNRPQLAAAYFRKANEAGACSKDMRKIILSDDHPPGAALGSNEYKVYRDEGLDVEEKRLAARPD